jgi:flagellar motility protein MotE (MotC chaperone)
MRIALPAPRLLPVTIAMIAVLLVVKCGIVVQAAVTDGQRRESAVVNAALAAEAEKPAAKPAVNQAPPLLPPPAEPPRPGAERAAAHAGEKPGEAPTAKRQEEPAPVSESEKAVLMDLRQRRKELDNREHAVAARESLLTAAEQKLTVRVGELQALQKKLEGLDAAQKQKEEAGWQGMVKLYEAMKPKDAATIFNELSMPVLVQVMDRMKDAKAAAVMAAMNPDKARDLTAELAQMRTGHDASGSSQLPGDPPPGGQTLGGPSFGSPSLGGPSSGGARPGAAAGPAASLKPNPVGG